MPPVYLCLPDAPTLTVGFGTLMAIAFTPASETTLDFCVDFVLAIR